MEVMMFRLITLSNVTDAYIIVNGVDCGITLGKSHRGNVPTISLWKKKEAIPKAI
jgi:hypothetical protein